MNAEQWRKCLGGLYSVSDRGRICAERPPSERRSGKIIKQSIHAKGYRVAWLRHADGSHETALVHRLVAAAFIGRCPSGKQVNHKNGIKVDNRVANLEYVTVSENHLHAFRTGLRRPQRGSDCLTTSLTEVDVARIKARRARGERGVVLASLYGISPQSVCNIVKGRTWRHV